MGESFKSRFFRFRARKRGRGERGRRGERETGRSEKARISTFYAFKTHHLLTLNFLIVKNLPLRGVGVGEGDAY
jgi:hypothetical protein